MKRKLAIAIAGCCLFFGKAAFAHRIDEYLQATVLSIGPNRVDASMRLIPGVLVAPSVIADIDANGDGVLSETEQQAYAQRVLNDLSITSDGRAVVPRLVSWSFPEASAMRDGLGEIRISYTVDLPQGGSERSFALANHHLSARSVYLMNVVVPEDRDLGITAQKRNEQQSTYEVDYEQGGAAAASQTWRGGLRSAVGAVQFSSLFRLGMRHIAEGTDHLLFLLTLLLPAPLLVAHRRWGQPAGMRRSVVQILKVVTAFTIGHSITLGLAAFGVVHVSGGPVEVLIAVSIFVSAVHALWPIVPGKEAWVAGFFGLIHGLAFAATLSRLGLGSWERVAGILAFNLGIETMQMLVVAGVLPSLLLMSRTRAYSFLRIGGAMFAAAASLGWMVERIFHQESRVDVLVGGIGTHALWIAGCLFLVSLGSRFILTPLNQTVATKSSGIRAVTLRGST